MKNFKLFLAVGVICAVFAVPAFAESMYVVTIKNADVKKVQDVLIEVFTGKNFNLDDVSNYRVVFTKGFGDGFWVASRKCLVKCNTLERDGNVRLVVTEEEVGAGYRRRSIDHLVPFIKEVKHAVDGTAIEAITNEAQNQLPESGNVREKTLGLKVSDDQKVLDVAAGSASQGKIFVGDRILEIDGVSAESMKKDSMTTYLNNKWGAGKSITFTVEHEGKKSFVTISK